MSVVLSGEFIMISLYLGLCHECIYILINVYERIKDVSL